MTDTTDPQTDRPRALHLLEAADFLRDAHFRDGLSVQEIGTALRRMADEADPMVGSLARDGFGLDEIAAMTAAPSAAVSPPPATDRAVDRDRIAAALSDARRPGLGGMTEAEAVAYMADAVLSVLPPAADRAAVLREAADAVMRLDYMELRADFEYDSQRDAWDGGTIDAANELRRLAAGERDEQQAQQGGSETRDALMAAHVALAEQAGRDQAALARVRQLHDRLAEETDLSGPDDLITKGSAARRIATALDGWNPALLPTCPVEFEGGSTCAKPAGHRPPGSDDPHVPAAPVAGQPPADTGEEAQPRFVRVCIACPECDHTLDENGACANGCHDKGPRP